MTGPGRELTSTIVFINQKKQFSTTRHGSRVDISSHGMPAEDRRLAGAADQLQERSDGGATLNTSASVVMPAAIFIAPAMRRGFMPSR